MRRPAALLLGLCIASGVQASTSPPSHVVLIMFDDLGFADVGAFGGETIVTHVLDALAVEGAAFTQYYAASPVCSPTRASLLTGLYPGAFGLHGVYGSKSARSLPVAVETLPDLLGAAGFVSGHFGKWHLGWNAEDFTPISRGFDEYAVSLTSRYRDQNFFVDDGMGEVTVGTTGHKTRTTTDFAIQFLQDHVGESVFLSVWYHAPHTPLEPPLPGELDPEYVANYPPYDGTEAGLYAQLLSDADYQLGRLLTALDDLGMAADTFLIVTSDNGPTSVGSTGVLSGEKGEVREGGIRVPFLARWPGRILEGMRSPALFVSFDVLPTLTELFGLTPATAALPGQSQLAALVDGVLPVRENLLVWERTRDVQGLPPTEEANRFAVRRGRWKLLHEDGSNYHLFDVQTDVTESQDLAPSHPGLQQHLLDDYRTWRLRTQRLDPQVDTMQGVSVSGPLQEFSNGFVRFLPERGFNFDEGQWSFQAGVTPFSVAGTQTLAERPDTWRLSLVNGVLVLSVFGPRLDDTPTATVLESDTPLQAGIEVDVAFSIYGFTRPGRASEVRLFVDGVLQSAVGAGSEPIERVWGRYCTTALVDVCVDSSDCTVGGCNTLNEQPVLLGNDEVGATPFSGSLRNSTFYQLALRLDELDADVDGVLNGPDACPFATGPGEGLDGDGDGWPDACDNCVGVANAGQEDADGDGIGDVCNAPTDDADLDGTTNGSDVCPTVSDPTQLDTDGDGVGDACNDAEDLDGDEFVGAMDVCPELPDLGQEDLDGDGFGDFCDLCPNQFDPDQIDTDRDGLGDACDASPFPPVSECANGLDDDADGLIDYPDDLGCASANASVESPACDDGFDNDRDTLVDGEDFGCNSPSDPSESPDCKDGLDNDSDGLTDHPNDPGCRNTLTNSREDPECQDGEDNDGDTLTDGADPECAASPAWWDDESMKKPPGTGCGLGTELLGLILVRALWRKPLRR